MRKTKKMLLASAFALVISTGFYLSAFATDVIVVGCKFTGIIEDTCTTGSLVITKCTPESGAANCSYTPGEVVPIIKDE